MKEPLPARLGTATVIHGEPHFRSDPNLPLQQRKTTNRTSDQTPSVSCLVVCLGVSGATCGRFVADIPTQLAFQHGICNYSCGPYGGAGRCRHALAQNCSQTRQHTYSRHIARCDRTGWASARKKRVDPGRRCIFLVYGGFLGVSRAVAHQVVPSARACSESKTQTRQASEADSSKRAFVVNLAPLRRRDPWRLARDKPGPDLGAQPPAHVLSLLALVAASISQYVCARCCVVSVGSRPKVSVAIGAVEGSCP